MTCRKIHYPAKTSLHAEAAEKDDLEKIVTRHTLTTQLLKAKSRLIQIEWPAFHMRFFRPPHLSLIKSLADCPAPAQKAHCLLVREFHSPRSYPRQKVASNQAVF